MGLATKPANGSNACRTESVNWFNAEGYCFITVDDWGTGRFRSLPAID